MLCRASGRDWTCMEVSTVRMAERQAQTDMRPTLYLGSLRLDWADGASCQSAFFWGLYAHLYMTHSLKVLASSP